MARALVLGAGFGGISAALGLADRLGPGQVTLVDEQATFRMGLGNLWLLDGRRRTGEGRRDLQALTAKGIHVVRGRIEAIDPASRSATVDGKVLAAEGLVIALGTQLAPEATPGFAAVHDLYEEAGAASFASELATFSGGTLLIQVCGMPFRCPPAPYEAALIAADVLRRRGIQADIHLATPEPHPLPVAPPEVGANLLPLLAQAGIQYHPNCKPTAFQAGRVEWENGQGLDYDLAAAVPVHKAPAVVAASGLAAPSGFIPVDGKTMQTKVANVYAVGDVCAITLPNGKMLPKAGVLAEAQGRVAAANLAASLDAGGARAEFEGKGTCYIETGEGKAIPAAGDFYASPQPRFDFAPASQGGLVDKQRFEADRLDDWFGASRSLRLTGSR
jgi:sulfide:quinone oxidoreductase